jgi:flagellar biosynthesis protein FlhG
MSVNSGQDQAEGLRRMLGPISTHRITFLSAVPSSLKNTVLYNLAAALVQLGKEIHLLDASQSTNGVCSTATAPYSSLTDIAWQNAPPQSALSTLTPGIFLSRLASQPLNQSENIPAKIPELSITLQQLKPELDFCLVDADLENDNPFILPELAQGDVTVIASPTAESIKSAYLHIKSLHALLGRRPYQVLMVNTLPQQAKLILENMSKTANHYLAVPLTSLGSIPPDEFLGRAFKQGRPIIEAFPTASASVAFRAIANQMLSHNTSGLSGQNDLKSQFTDK